MINKFRREAIVLLEGYALIGTNETEQWCMPLSEQKIQREPLPDVSFPSYRLNSELSVLVQNSTLIRLSKL